MLQRVAESPQDISTAQEKLVEEVGGTPEGTREDGFMGVQRNIHQKEICPQYKLAESNLNHSRYVSTNYSIKCLD